MFGTILLGIDFFIPTGTPVPIMPAMMVFSFRLIGFMLTFSGLVILFIRIYQVGVHLFINPVNPKRVILIHQRRGKHPNAKFISGKLEDLEHISCKNKLFKDTGGGFRIAGHDVRRTHETICHDIPEWLGQYFHQIRERYGVDNLEQLNELYKKLKDLKDKKDLVDIIDPDIITDEQRKYLITDMKIEDLRNMAEILYDGKVIHMEDAEEFIASATPNELDSWVGQKFTHRMMQFKSYHAPGAAVDWKTWIPLMIVLFVGAAIAMRILGQ